ncbi:MAG TPA: hypothetical protein VEY94_13010, partial [Patescibacteria group bacterium]|nr:hypothetical protein [Patescibacteria group bacterium]
MIAHSHSGAGVPARHHLYRFHAALVTILLCAMFLAMPSSLRANDTEKNLLANGNFAKGSEDQPDSWRTEAWINNPDSFQAHWHSYTVK